MLTDQKSCTIPSMDNDIFNTLINTVKSLREPETGCAWDLKQTASSLCPSLLEEVCECMDAAHSNDDENLKEELGDVVFTSLLISYIKEQEGAFSVDEVLKTASDKMIRRHPHVFGDASAETSDEVLTQWDRIKAEVEGRISERLLGKIPSSLPSLLKAWEIQKKAAKVGFDWPSVDQVWDKVHEEIDEVKQEIEDNNREKLEEEIGDLLFSVVNIARFLKVDPDRALTLTNRKFTDRFNKVEDKMKALGKEMSTENFELMDSLWEEVKK